MKLLENSLKKKKGKTFMWLTSCFGIKSPLSQRRALSQIFRETLISDIFLLATCSFHATLRNDFSLFNSSLK